MSEIVIRYQSDTGNNCGLKSGKDPMTGKKKKKTLFIYLFKSACVDTTHICASAKPVCRAVEDRS